MAVAPIALKEAHTELTDSQAEAMVGVPDTGGKRVTLEDCRLSTTLAVEAVASAESKATFMKPMLAEDIP